MGEIRVRRVDAASERERILGVLSANLSPAAVPQRFDWLYLSNPDGPALVWLAEDDRGTAVGTSAAYPRRMRVAGDLVRALHLGDFAVERARRALGPALHLLSATLTPVRDGTYALSYDFPSPSMHAVYRRMRVRALGRSERWMQPVAIGRLLRDKVGLGPFAAVVGAAGDALWQARRSMHGRARGVRLEVLPGDCGEEFDAFEARVSQGRLVAGVRDAAYLNWRYLRHPLSKHQILCARSDRELVGYAVVVRRSAPGTVSLVDMQGEDVGVRRELLSGALRWAASQDAGALDVEVLAESPAARMVRELGFLRRESKEGPVGFWRPDDPLAAQLETAQNWWLMGGDRDA
jgi:hypothetical protein